MPCAAPTTVVGGVTLSTNNFENAQALIATVGSDQSDPTADEYEGYIANGNNTNGTTGIQQSPLPTQTTLPPPSSIPPKQTNDTPASGKNGTPVVSPTWDGSNYDIAMSTNFILRNFTVGYGSGDPNTTSRGCLFPNELNDGFGLTKQQRFENLQALSVNILEPLWNKFGPFRINSGIRNENSVKPPGISQHCTGQAVDIQFPDWTYDSYWQNAPWVKDNLPFDQFIFEHSSRTKTVWFHLSYNSSGGRSTSDPTKVMTMYRGCYDSGLKRYY
jgi:hypothetical protein